MNQSDQRKGGRTHSMTVALIGINAIFCDIKNAKIKQGISHRMIYGWIVAGNLELHYRKKSALKK